MSKQRRLRKGKAGFKLDSDFSIHIPDLHDINWMFDIPVKHYLKYRSRSRPVDNCNVRDYWSYVTPDDTHLREIMYDLIEEYFDSRINGNSAELAQLVQDFVLKLPYQERKTTHVKFPIETLCEFGGNCADLSVLAASMLQYSSIDCCFILFPEHVNLGIGVQTDGTYLDVEGKKYYISEFTGTDWPTEPKERKIGDCSPDELKDIELHFKDGRRVKID